MEPSAGPIEAKLSAGPIEAELSMGLIEAWYKNYLGQEASMDPIEEKWIVSLIEVKLIRAWLTLCGQTFVKEPLGFWGIGFSPMFAWLKSTFSFLLSWAQFRQSWEWAWLRWSQAKAQFY